ncbi:SCO3870 family protein [Kitasatospora kifunensis]|uniref:Uncharacterized protein n=1 Tax=Kitasatospora kifunensis TaxID=58351 RepID=A0A7W7R6N4_KITKI|nr:SCO3870 family protein [Kitasatospora kifunensis]MBB4926300.1 hypothetical protein [Kitasatospora kifunensis]
MTKVPFGAVSIALAGLGTVLAFLASRLRADGYEQYAGALFNFSAEMYVTALLVVLTWALARRRHSG